MIFLPIVDPLSGRHHELICSAAPAAYRCQVGAPLAPQQRFAGSPRPAAVPRQNLGGAHSQSTRGGGVWLGGAPKDMPPRPGTPEYDAFTKKQEAEANRDKSKDPPKPKAETPKLTQ